MRFITSADEFNRISRLLDSLVQGHGHLTRDSFRGNFSSFLFMSFSSVFSRAFFDGLRILSSDAGDGPSFVLANDPDPVWYAREFSRFNAVGFDDQDNPDDYIAALNETPPQGNSADSLMDSSSRLFFFSESRSWLIVSDREINLTFCCFSGKENMGSFKKAYSGDFFEDAHAAEEFSFESTGNSGSLTSFS